MVSVRARLGKESYNQTSLWADFKTLLKLFSQPSELVDNEASCKRLSSPPMRFMMSYFNCAPYCWMVTAAVPCFPVTNGQGIPLKGDPLPWGLINPHPWSKARILTQLVVLIVLGKCKVEWRIKEHAAKRGGFWERGTRGAHLPSTRGRGQEAIDEQDWKTHCQR